ncbi:hypoxanthine-guanine phosphoribosyltransferase, putative [Bodo saltans]|uniref:Hypoxanthine phosphoribosyltransferase n=2 Tax=Bodo saltans TaxID=75058 RepID=A0A0S4JHI0_BODSA|nr:hypoxanthine-guanine phosphoribosyltransferase, putative [Bodo saltans]|eukprot:CUG91003.1 hypoxanthine-guanine phosphoribosyltransferase, putative [Bodo saltans]
MTSSSTPLVVNGRSYSFAKKCVASQEQIFEKIDAIAANIAIDYAGKATAENPLILICVLKGAYLFTADLARALADKGVPNVVEFMCVSSYGKYTVSSGEVRMLLDLRNSISKRHCLIVEDILDSARTLDFLYKVFMTRGPASLRTCVLLDKPEGRKLPFVAHYRCFEIANEFVVGYGLDYAEMYRDLRDIVVLKPEVYSPKTASEMHKVPDSKL